MRSQRLVGVGLVLVSAASFGTAGVLARVAYDDGADPTALLACRFAIAAALFAAARLARPSPRPRGRALAGLGVMGVGYLLQSFCYFTAVDHAPPGLVALLLYTYPALVVVLGAVALHLRVPRRVAAACVAALAGTALIVVPTIGGTADVSTLGVGLGLGAALVYSGYILLGTKVLETVDPLWASTVIMATAAAGYAVVFAATRPALPSTVEGWAAVVAVAVVCTVVAASTFLAGLARIGPADASTISTFEPVVSVVLSAVFIGEAVSGWTAAGGALVLGAVLAISRATR